MIRPMMCMEKGPLLLQQCPPFNTHTVLKELHQILSALQGYNMMMTGKTLQFWYRLSPYVPCFKPSRVSLKT
eukprot:c38747_g1_i1 orf=3-215(-)